MFKDFSKKYLGELKEGMDNIDLEKLSKIVEILEKAYENDKQVFIFGNGGSCATASHFAEDLNKCCLIENEKRFRVISLTDNIPLISALANDEGYEFVFSKQLEGLMEEGDVVIGISGSGNSENVLNGIKFGNEKGISIGLGGFDGGKLKDLCKECLIVPLNHMGKVEDLHLVIAHMIIYYFIRKNE
ncbi:phosphoheptose isomerase [archaeon]|nr:phosphoheptose isomerase [archaeon]